MEVILDTLGCEAGPEMAISAGITARETFQIDIAFSGIPEQIQQFLSAKHADLDLYRIVPAHQKIEMSDPPWAAIKQKNDASITVAMKDLAANRSDALVSAGHTGATVVTAKKFLGCLPAIRRPALCQVMPTASGKQFLFMDVGATVSTSESDFHRFALMGHIAARHFFGMESPRIALLNIGTESLKGNRELRKASNLLSKSPINFVGNVEGDNLWFDSADVILTNGITGNILLKSSEGLIRVFFKQLKKLPGSVLKIFEPFNPSNYGGALLLGVNGICVICHGRADESAHLQAIKRAIWASQQQLHRSMAEYLESVGLNTLLE